MSFCADNEKRDGEEQQLKIAQCMRLLMLLVLSTSDCAGASGC